MLRKGILIPLIAIALAAGFITATFAQQTPRLALLKPLLLDIQQTVPFSLTLTLPYSGETITVPSELDVAMSIQIRTDGSVSPTINIVKTEPTVAVVNAHTNASYYGCHHQRYCMDGSQCRGQREISHL